MEEPTPKEIIKENFDATVLEARIEKLETELNQIKENFSKKETEKEDFSNDDLIDQKARLEADIAKLTAEKPKQKILLLYLKTLKRSSYQRMDLLKQKLMRLKRETLLTKLYQTNYYVQSYQKT